MPRQPRLDTPGALHHIMGRGIERTKIFRKEEDRIDFVNRLADLCKEGAFIIYAWALMPNHYHILVRTGKKPLSDSMRRLLTGYVVNFNRRHKRGGHLFQNRYKSIICEDDPCKRSWLFWSRSRSFSGHIHPSSKSSGER